jgi:hypothetical protein
MFFSVLSVYEKFTCYRQAYEQLKLTKESESTVTYLVFRLCWTMLKIAIPNANAAATHATLATNS